MKSMQMFHKPVQTVHKGDRVGRARTRRCRRLDPPPPPPPGLLSETRLVSDTPPLWIVAPCARSLRRICFTQLDSNVMERGLLCEPGSVPTLTSVVRERSPPLFRSLQPHFPTIAPRVSVFLLNDDALRRCARWCMRTRPPCCCLASENSFSGPRRCAQWSGSASSKGQFQPSPASTSPWGTPRSWRRLCCSRAPPSQRPPGRGRRRARRGRPGPQQRATSRCACSTPLCRSGQEQRPLSLSPIFLLFPLSAALRSARDAG